MLALAERAEALGYDSIWLSATALVWRGRGTTR